MVIRECILKLCTTNRASGRPPAEIEIEVSSQQDWRIRAVPPSILQGLVKLRTPQLIIAFAFQVQVIGNDRFARNVGLADQGQAPSESFLEWIDFRKEPTRAPEIRLPSESENAGI